MINLSFSLNKLLKNIYFYICILYISGATYLVAIDWLFIPFTLLGFYLFLVNNNKWDHIIKIVLFVYILITIYSYNILGSERFSINATIGMFFRLLMPYFLLKIFKDEFFDKYERLMYYAALISLPCYLLTLYDYNFFLNIFPSLNMSVQERIDAGYWNFFFYTTHGYPDFVRNDGFAIEPGHFGYLLGIAIFFNLIKNDFSFNKRLNVLLIAGITTFSTTFYISLFLLMLFYFYNVKTSNYIKLLFLILTFISFYFIGKTEMGFEKINTMQQNAQNNLEFGVDDVSSEALSNRFSTLYVEFDNFFNYPFGYSTNDSGKKTNSHRQTVSGANGLMHFIVFWGVIGVFFLFYSFYFLLQKLKYLYPNVNFLIVFLFILLVYLFSNSISRDILIFLILLYPFINTNNIKLQSKKVLKGNP